MYKRACPFSVPLREMLDSMLTIAVEKRTSLESISSHVWLHPSADEVTTVSPWDSNPTASTVDLADLAEREFLISPGTGFKVKAVLQKPYESEAATSNRDEVSAADRSFETVDACCAEYAKYFETGAFSAIKLSHGVELRAPSNTTGAPLRAEMFSVDCVLPSGATNPLLAADVVVSEAFHIKALTAAVPFPLLLRIPHRANSDQLERLTFCRAELPDGDMQIVEGGCFYSSGYAEIEVSSFSVWKVALLATSGAAAAAIAYSARVHVDKPMGVVAFASSSPDESRSIRFVMHPRGEPPGPDHFNGYCIVGNDSEVAVRRGKQVRIELEKDNLGVGVTFAPWDNTRQSQMLPERIPPGLGTITAAIDQTGVVYGESTKRKFTLKLSECAAQPPQPLVPAPAAATATKDETVGTDSVDAAEVAQRKLEEMMRSRLHLLKTTSEVVHIISTPFGSEAGRSLALQVARDNERSGPGVRNEFCYNPNEDCPQSLGVGWLDTWMGICDNTVVTGGNVFVIFRSDGQGMYGCEAKGPGSLDGQAQAGEVRYALSKGCTIQWMDSSSPEASLESFAG